MWQGKIEAICALAIGASLVIATLQGQKDISEMIITGILGYMGRDLIYQYQMKKEDEKK